MKNALLALLLVVAIACSSSAQDVDGSVKLGLPIHNGKLELQAPGFKTVQASAKANGQELGFRMTEASGRLEFLVFLFMVPEEAPLTSMKCRDFIMGHEKEDDPTLKVTEMVKATADNGQPLEVVQYTRGKASESSAVRIFTATGDVCGDLEVYSRDKLSAGDATIKRLMASLRLDAGCVPQFEDIFLYGQILYAHDMFPEAAPILELALSKIPGDKDQLLRRRVITDNAGMAYGISGNLRKARELFENAIKTDPDYPLYYYNLACADAEEGNLKAARIHLEQAFARKANVLPGESIPDPKEDDSFLPHRGDKEFWAFLQTLR
jgi:hypothetical protein